MSDDDIAKRVLELMQVDNPSGAEDRELETLMDRMSLFGVFRAVQRMLDRLRTQNKRLREALQNLMDEQNGPPLFIDRMQWNEAMMQAQRALGCDPIYDHLKHELLKEDKE